LVIEKCDKQEIQEKAHDLDFKREFISEKNKK
jgi:hypothetical protein